MSEFFAEYGFTIGSLSAVFVAFITSGVAKFFKRTLATNVVTNFISKFKKEVGEENFTELSRIVKEYGVKKIEEVVGKVLEENAELKANVDKLNELLKVMATNQIALGVYKDNPELESKVKELL